jgi:hypothetical protein
LHAHDPVYVVRLQGESVAYPVSTLARRGVIEDATGGGSIILIATGDDSGARAFAAGGLRLAALDAGATTLVSADGRRWRVTEAALVADDGSRLARLPGHNSLWFVVVNHAAVWRLYQES